MPNDDCDKKRNTYRLKNPKNVNLPFFAYDVFKIGEIAYSRISDFVESYEPHYTLNYSLNIDNGVPFLVRKYFGDYSTVGTLIKFRKEDAYEAYKVISEAKSFKLYRWATIGPKYNKINVLFGREDIINFEYAENAVSYNSTNDPMLMEVIPTICENFFSIIGEPCNPGNFLNLQINYMLLWSSIDRYLVLKYGKRFQQENLDYLAKEKAFKKAVLEFSDIGNKKPSVFSNEDFRSFQLDRTKPLCCIRYYYTIRCNVVHTGKSNFDDYKLLKKSLFELLMIYMYVLRCAFDDEILFNNEFEEMKFMVEKGVYDMIDRIF